jgi:hypothetical protein
LYDNAYKALKPISHNNKMDVNNQLPVVIEKKSFFPSAYVGGIHIRKPTMAFAVKNSSVRIQRWSYTPETRMTMPEGSFWCVGCGYWKSISPNNPCYVSSFRVSDGERAAQLHCDGCAEYMVNTFSSGIKCYPFGIQMFSSEEAYVAKMQHRERNAKKVAQAWRQKVLKSKETTLFNEVLPQEFIQWANLREQPLGVKFA